MRSKFKLAFYIGITALLTLGFSISLQSILAEWTAPTDNPPAQLGIKSPVYNWGDESSHIINNSLGVLNNFSAGIDNLFVDDSTGNVGIGTTTPAQRLEINGITRSLNFESYKDNIDSKSGLIMRNPNGFASIYSSGALGNGIGFYTSSDEENPRMVIGANGNVGIGTSNLTATLNIDSTFKVVGAKYQISSWGIKPGHINGPRCSCDINSYNSECQNLFVGRDVGAECYDWDSITTGDSKYIRIVAETNTLGVDKTGRVGIWTTSPAESLDLGGGNVKMGYERVQSAASGGAICSVTCPIGKYVVGGGCGQVNGGVYLINSYADTTNRWACQYSGGSCVAHAICANIR